MRVFASSTPHQVSLDVILDECIDLMVSGSSNLEECLQRYPDQADFLQPLLIAAAQFGDAGSIEIPQAVKQRGRTHLVEYVHSHPRKPIIPVRFVLALATIILAFVTSGTAFAQRAIPGDPLYGWKRSSEDVWRAFSPDPVGVDLKLSERRTRELLAVSADPVHVIRAQEEYKKSLIRLLSEIEPQNKHKIIPVVLKQHDVLENAGISIPAVEELMPVHIDAEKSPPGNQGNPPPGSNADPGKKSIESPGPESVAPELPILPPGLNKP